MNERQIEPILNKVEEDKKQALNKKKSHVTIETRHDGLPLEKTKSKKLNKNMS